MEITNAVALIAVLVTILGWFIATRFNKRLDYRLKTLESFIPIAQDILKLSEISDVILAKKNRIND